MRNVGTGKIPQVSRWLPKRPSPSAVTAAGESCAEAVRDGVDDIRRRFLTVKSVAGSPLRDDLDRCLTELDALIAALHATSPVLTYLQFEIEQHHLKIVHALDSGYEL